MNILVVETTLINEFQYIFRKAVELVVKDGFPNSTICRQDNVSTSLILVK